MYTCNICVSIYTLQHTATHCNTLLTYHTYNYRYKCDICIHVIYVAVYMWMYVVYTLQSSESGNVWCMYTCKYISMCLNVWCTWIAAPSYIQHTLPRILVHLHVQIAAAYRLQIAATYRLEPLSTHNTHCHGYWYIYTCRLLPHTDCSPDLRTTHIAMNTNIYTRVNCSHV